MAQREQILEQALSLPPEDRAYIAIALEDSLATQAAGSPATASESDHGQAACVAEFLTELERRSAAYRAGTTAARPAAQVLADLRQRQASETPA